MRLIIGTVLFLVLMLVNLSFTYQAGPGPKKKVYKDTIYRFKTKPVPSQNNTQPVVKAKPAEKTLPKTPAPKIPEVAEEDRLINIYAEITKFVVKKICSKNVCLLRRYIQSLQNIFGSQSNW